MARSMRAASHLRRHRPCAERLEEDAPLVGVAEVGVGRDELRRAVRREDGPAREGVDDKGHVAVRRSDQQVARRVQPDHLQPEPLAHLERTAHLGIHETQRDWDALPPLEHGVEVRVAWVVVVGLRAPTEEGLVVVLACTFTPEEHTRGCGGDALRVLGVTTDERLELEPAPRLLGQRVDYDVDLATDVSHILRRPLFCGQQQRKLKGSCAGRGHSSTEASARLTADARLGVAQA
eukprot:scaffold63892_cov75-Phaeocystis_antarctica.AAC.3